MSECKICGQAAVKYGNGTYYLEDGKRFPLPFFYCRHCNSFIREVDEASIRSHLKAASHTDMKNEAMMYRRRIGFFRYLYSLAGKRTGSISGWLDFGCSYGHLIGFLRGINIDSDGIEIAEVIRDHALSKGLTVFDRIENLPDGKEYDVISLIDSLYYSGEPADLVRKLYSKTRMNGLLIVRIANRNWLAKLKKKVFRKEIGLSLGDATIGFSKKSITYLLENSGYKILKITGIEKGKSLPLKTLIFYWLTFLLNTLSVGWIDLSPGLIVVARKGPDCPGNEQRTVNSEKYKQRSV